MSQNNVKDLALKYIEFAGSKNKQLLILKERIVGSDPRTFMKDYGLANRIYPVVEVKVLMALKADHVREERKVADAGPVRKQPSTIAEQMLARPHKAPDSVQPAYLSGPVVTPQPPPGPVVGPNIARPISRPFAQPFTYDAKKLGATIAQAPNYPPPVVNQNNVVPPPPMTDAPSPLSAPGPRTESAIVSGKKIFYPIARQNQGATFPPPLVSQQPPPVRPPPSATRPPAAVTAPPRPVPPPLAPRSVFAPEKAEEEKKENIPTPRKPSMASPVPPPPPAVVMPSANAASMIKGTPPPMKGRILEQANFGIRPFKHDARFHV